MSFVAGGSAMAEVIPDRPLLRVENLSKTFGATRVLNSVTMEVRAGSVHSLIGQNGSGKSTLVKLLSGYHHADNGARYWYEGESCAAEYVGKQLRFVHQNLGLVAELSAIENLALRAALPRTTSGRRTKRRDERAQAIELLARLGLPELDVTRPLASATVVERTVVAIAAALAGWIDDRSGVLVLDEPTAVMAPRETNRLLSVIRDLRDAGTGIIYVSHRLDELFEISNEVTVLRNGNLVATRPINELDPAELVRLMVGSDIEPHRRFLAQSQTGEREPVLVAQGVAGTRLRGVDLTLGRGEIVGIAGLPDSGRDELPRLLTDQARRATGGRIRTAHTRTWSPLKRWRKPNTVLLPSDRGRDGLVGEMTGVENLTLSTISRLSRATLVDPRREAKVAADWTAQLEIAGDLSSPVSTLSGGNQQKVLLGRCLAATPEALVVCEPTAGVDVGARQAIYTFIAREASKGLAVLVVSSDVNDLFALCNRVIVLRDGRVDGELSGAQITEGALVSAMEGMGIGADASSQTGVRW